MGPSAGLFTTSVKDGINIIIPTKLDRKQKSLLQDLAKTDLEDSPEFRNFRKYLN